MGLTQVNTDVLNYSTRRHFLDRKGKNKAVLPSEKHANKLATPQVSKAAVPGCREVAGTVTRTSNRVVAAQPPPAPSTTRASSSFRNNKPRKSRKAGGGPGNNSDSESDDEDRKRKLDGDADVTVLRQLPAEDPGPDHSAGAQKRIDALIQFRRNFKFVAPSISKRVLERDQARQGYLEEVLYGVIKEDEDEEEHSQLDDLEEIVDRVESELVNRVSHFEEWKVRKLQTHQRIIMALDRAEKELWKSPELMDAVANDEAHNAKSFAQNIRGIVDSFLLKDASLPDTTQKTFIDRLADACWEDIISYITVEILSATTEDLLESSPSGAWLEPFEESRINHASTPAYRQWLIGSLTPGNERKLCRELYRLKRQEIVREYKSCMETVKMSVKQEFCLGAVHPDEVSLVLMKGNHLTGVRAVSRSTLRAMGWFHDMATKDYWRCALYDKNDDSVELIKVSMDGEVLGLFCLDKGLPVCLEYWEPEENYGITVRPMYETEWAALDLV
ncbi:hypothetical protein G7054_g14737 [Neopestalotiopsis clavispora]|nr:hypothetical protein G7054_g14737 [Neopestalotiopsis clavispora]